MAPVSPSFVLSFPFHGLEKTAPGGSASSPDKASPIRDKSSDIAEQVTPKGEASAIHDRSSEIAKARARVSDLWAKIDRLETQKSHVGFLDSIISPSIKKRINDALEQTEREIDSERMNIRILERMSEPKTVKDKDSKKEKKKKRSDDSATYWFTSFVGDCGSTFAGDGGSSCVVDAWCGASSCM